MKKLMIIPFLWIILGSIAFTKPAKTLSVKSPDGKITVDVALNAGIVSYSVSKENKIVINSSKLGFKFRNADPMEGNFTVISSDTRSFDETWEQPWGERRFVTNNYNEIRILLQEKSKLKRRLDIVFRAFNDGIGFRYEFPKQTTLDNVEIISELTEFNLATMAKAWWIPALKENEWAYEDLYQCTPVNKLDTVNTPLTLETENGLYLSIHEAALLDYSSMILCGNGSTNLKCDLVSWANGVKVYAKAPFHTPWRTIQIGDTPGDLITSYMILNLNEPSKIKDVSWIKPMRYVGIWWEMHQDLGTWALGEHHSANTANVLKYMDFAAANGFSGVLVEGWNQGWEHEWFRDGSKFNFTKPYPDFDIDKITSYGKAKNVKLIGHHETGGATVNYENQLDSAFAFYNKYGVNSVKTGYVSSVTRRMDGKEWHHGQYGVRHYSKVMETAAKYNIMLDVHEPIKPTGLQRTYPNLMSHEGARGQEYDAWSADGGNPPEHTTILPFTRLLAGPMDFTPGTFKIINPDRPRFRVNTTLVKQLALYVVIYSPLQMASDLPENYAGNKAFDFIKTVPVDWSETKVLNAKIGDYVTIARKDRNSENWYIGSITDENGRDLKIDLSFLDKDADYVATIYTDGDDADWKTNPYDFIMKEIKVNSSTTLNLKLAAGGGTAISLKKIQ